MSRPVLDAHRPDAHAATPLPADHSSHDTLDVIVGGEPSTTTDQESPDTQCRCVGGGDSDPPATGQKGHDAQPPLASRGWVTLRILSEMFYDAQQNRIALTNRLVSETVWPDPVLEAVDAAERSEKKLGLAMRRCFRTAAPEVYQWTKDTPGVGEHLIARLLGAIGDPRIAYPHHWEGEGTARVLVQDDPYLRTVSQLWSYCGIGDPTRKRRKGMTADEATALGNPHAKMLCRLLAESAMKCAGSETRKRSPYRDVYDESRATYEADRDWTKGHCHNAALRKTAKAIIRDLWKIAPAPDLGHERADTHAVAAEVGLSATPPTRRATTPMPDPSVGVA